MSKWVEPEGKGLGISVTDLSVDFRTRDHRVVHATKKLDLEILPGEFVAVVGQSGCGKSTLLRVLAGLNETYSGQAALDGEAITRPRRDVGVMFQTPVLLPWRTALENVVLPQQIAGVRKRAVEEEARQMLEMTGLAGFADKHPWELSGGMQQRVALSRALLGRPRLLLMDEPFGALDEFTRERLNIELLRIWAELSPTVVLVTHSIDEAVLLADRVVMMTGQPGEIAGIEEIRLARPRSLGDVGSPQFAQHVTNIRSTLGVAS
jgi:NitT/TauT family transport system ATP-binding protein